MRIISDFKDYYDRHESSDPIYIRKTVEFLDCKEVRLNEHWLDGLRSEYSYNHKQGHIGAHPHLLVLCGKGYVWYRSSLGIVFDDHQSVVKFFGEATYKPFIIERKITAERWKRLMSDDISDINHYFGSPIVYIRRNTDRTVQITVDPSLKMLSFNRFMSADQCHQNIEMFIGGVLASRENGSSSMNDKEKLISHGMDPKWSFRNPDPPRRKRKK